MNSIIPEFDNQVGGHSFSGSGGGILKSEGILLKQMQNQGRGYALCEAQSFDSLLILHSNL